MGSKTCQTTLFLTALPLGGKIRWQFCQLTFYLLNIKLIPSNYPLEAKEKRKKTYSNFCNLNWLISQMNNLDLRHEIIWKRTSILSNFILYLSTPTDATISQKLMLVCLLILPFKLRSLGLIAGQGFLPVLKRQGQDKGKL